MLWLVTGALLLVEFAPSIIALALRRKDKNEIIAFNMVGVVYLDLARFTQLSEVDDSMNSFSTGVAAVTVWFTALVWAIRRRRGVIE